MVKTRQAQKMKPQTLKNSSTTEINRKMASAAFTPKDGEAIFNLRSPIEVNNASGESASDLKELSFVGYSGAPVDLSDYGLDAPMIYNISGISHKASVPILHEHWTPIGHTTSITQNADSLQGKGVTSYPSQEKAMVVEALKNGFPFEGSMGLRIQNESDIVFLKSGEKRTINNRAIEGPMYVAERSVLKEMTITMSGRDSDTQFDLLNKEAITMLKNSVPRNIKNSAVPPATPPVDQSAPVVPPVVQNTTPVVAAPAIHNAAPSRKDFVKLTKLLNSFPQESDFIEQQYEAGQSLDQIENSIKVKMWENGLPRVPNIKPDQGQSQEDTIAAHFALAVGVKPETVAKYIDKKIVDNADSRPKWGWVETLLNIANAQEGNRRFTGFSDIDLMCKSIKNHNRQLFLNASYSTIDMPNLLRKSTDWILEDRWTINEPFAAKHLKEESNKDFRRTERYRASGGTIWDTLPDSGKIEMTEFGNEQRYLSDLDTIAQLVVWSRKDVINDDMGVIASMLEAMVEGALIVPDQKLGRKMLVQAAAAATFWVNSDNSFTTTALTRANLSARYNAARQYNENRGPNYVNLINDRWTLITSISGEEAAWEILKQDRIVNDTTSNTKTGDKNYWFGKLDLLVFPQMSNISLLNRGVASTFCTESTWLLWPSSSRFAPYSITYLRGQKRPTIEAVELPENMLGMGVRGYWDVEINEREREAVVRCNNG
jgi:hypothetical protein